MGCNRVEGRRRKTEGFEFGRWKLLECGSRNAEKKEKQSTESSLDNLRSGGELEILITSIYFINIKTNHNLKSGQTYR